MDPIEGARAAFRRGDYQEALAIARPSAERGHADAQIILGGAYASGMGVGRDRAMAWMWLRLAMDQGHKNARKSLFWLSASLMQDFSIGHHAQVTGILRPLAEGGDRWAQIHLGHLYGAIDSPVQSCDEGLKWSRAAAESGDPELQYEFALLRDEGRCPNDPVDAGKWYRSAADQGYAPAQIKLAKLYETGRGVVQNDVEAIRWYRNAAVAGYASAQLALGRMYEHGLGVPPNKIEAYKWFLFAHSRADGATESFKRSVRTMTPEDIAEAQRFVEASQAAD